MKYQITSDNISLSPSMENLAKEKFAKIEKHLKDSLKEISIIRIVLNKSQDVAEKFVVKADFTVGGHKYFSDETDFSLDGAIIKVVDELMRMLQKEKDKEDSAREEGWKEIRSIKRGEEKIEEIAEE